MSKQDTENEEGLICEANCDCVFCTAVRDNNITDENELIIISEITDGLMKVKAAEMAAEEFCIDIKRKDIANAISQIMSQTKLFVDMSEGTVTEEVSFMEKVTIH